MFKSSIFINRFAFIIDLKRIQKILSLFIVSVALAACSKNRSSDKDRELPGIIITNPINNEVFSNGQTVTITANLSDNKIISEVHVHISNNTTNQLLIDIHRSPASSNYALSESFVAQSGIQYKVQIIAKDNSANENRASVIITVN